MEKFLHARDKSESRHFFSCRQQVTTISINPSWTNSCNQLWDDNHTKYLGDYHQKFTLSYSIELRNRFCLTWQTHGLTHWKSVRLNMYRQRSLTGMWWSFIPLLCIWVFNYTQKRFGFPAGLVLPLSELSVVLYAWFGCMMETRLHVWMCCATKQ